MALQTEIANPALDEVLAAIGTRALLDAQCNAERVDAIFRTFVPIFVGRYPHHKLLAHLCEAAKDGVAEEYIARHRGLAKAGSL